MQFFEWADVQQKQFQSTQRASSLQKDSLMSMTSEEDTFWNVRAAHQTLEVTKDLNTNLFPSHFSCATCFLTSNTVTHHHVTHTVKSNSFHQHYQLDFNSALQKLEIVSLKPINFAEISMNKMCLLHTSLKILFSTLLKSIVKTINFQKSMLLMQNTLKIIYKTEFNPRSKKQTKKPAIHGA